MNVGNRNLFSDNNQTSYSINGLIAMYDGENNAGIGIHNANTTIWKNLGSLGSEYDAIATSPVWGDNYASFTYNMLNNQFAIKGDIQSSKMRGEYSVEFVFMPRSRWSRNYSGIIGNHGEKRGFLGGQVGDFSIFEPETASYHIDPPTLMNSYHAIGAYASANSRRFKWTLDGNIAKTFDVEPENITLDFAANRAFMIGASWTYFSYPSDAARTFDGNIYCVRIYNRELSDAERKSNYAIDAMRFNLQPANDIRTNAI